MGEVRTACPDCKGCDACFQAGRSHEVDQLKARLKLRIESLENTYTQRELWTLKVRNAHAQSAKLGARIHALRERVRSLHEVRIHNAAIRLALGQAHGELTDQLRAALDTLDDHLEGENRARRREWEATQRETPGPVLVPYDGRPVG